MRLPVSAVKIELRSRQQFLQFIQQDRFIGKLADRFLGMNDFAIHFHFKHTAAAGNEGQVFDTLTECTQQFARQTDGLWGVVSHHAKRDGDVHVFSLSLSYRRLRGDASI